MGRPEEAIVHFRAAAALYSDDPNTILNIGTYDQLHGNIAAAIADYRKAAEMARNPKTKGRAYNNLGYAYQDAGDLANARASLQLAVQADPEYVGAWIGLGCDGAKDGRLAVGDPNVSARDADPSIRSGLFAAGIGTRTER